MGYTISANINKLPSSKAREGKLSFDGHYERGTKLCEHIDTADWVNSPCVIIGGGESLRGVSDDSIPAKYKRIGINRAYEKYRCDLVYTMDALFLKMIHRGDMDVYTGKNIKHNFENLETKIVLLSPDDSEKIDTSRYFLVKRLTEMQVSKDVSNGIWAGNNSGLGGMMLAIALGCNPIYLLGFDLKIVKDSHWHAGYPNQVKEKLYDKHAGFRKVFDQASPMIHDAGISIYNCSDNTSLTCFNKMKIGDL